MADGRLHPRLALFGAEGSPALTAVPRVFEQSAWKSLPTVYGYREHVIPNGLVSYGVDLRWCYRRAASFVIKILRGIGPVQ
jgi:hypothetical protein